MVSAIHLWSGPAPVGICNSIGGTLDVPPAPGEDRSPTRNANSGAFNALARDKCGGTYNLHFTLVGALKKAGPRGNAALNVWSYGNPGELTVLLRAPMPDIVGIRESIVVRNVTLGKETKIVLEYNPKIQFSTTTKTPLYESQGWVIGAVIF
jgi:hypothetical protein